MTFDNLIRDIKQLKGTKLNSIRPGSDIIIHNVDTEHAKVEIVTINGILKSRPLSEIQKLWKELCSCPAVHVDKVLSGSGSSRNQPETILANLPYIEWFKFDNKKHIVFVGKSTHPLGTLKQMDAVEAEKIRGDS